MIWRASWASTAQPHTGESRSWDVGSNGVLSGMSYKSFPAIGTTLPLKQVLIAVLVCPRNGLVCETVGKEA